MRNLPTLMQFLEYSLWLLVVVLALILQVSPFMLALTLMVYSVGASASASLAFTLCVFALIFYARWASAQRKQSRMDRWRWGN